MISELNIKNFKCIKECKLKLKDYNIFCGVNACGKSSAIQAILLLAQNYKQENRCLFNGRSVKLGEFEEIKNFDINIREKIIVEVVNENGKKNKIIVDNDNKIEYKRNFLLEEEKNIYYLSANRLGYADTYETSNGEIFFGINGEYAISFLAQHKGEYINDEYVFDKKDKASKTFINEVNYWLKRITDSEIDTNKIYQTNKVVANYTNVPGRKVRSSNTGSGLSYLISILIMGLGVSFIKSDSSQKDIIIIENPEIHLHPKAQILLSEFLTFISQKNQIIIETHSDHIVNGIRIGVKKQCISNNAIGIFHFDKKNKSYFVNKITIDVNGKLSNWPENFFDEYEKSLELLF